ncbi:hypothetical protein [Nocardia sp. NPDC060259]|uniref:hypothetical protein n=1 Tax=Nocardia sp. NPDC060259 TaxID=3347088 RepID=UPI003669DFFC
MDLHTSDFLPVATAASVVLLAVAEWTPRPVRAAWTAAAFLLTVLCGAASVAAQGWRWQFWPVTVAAGALTGARLDTLLDRISTPEVRRRAAAYAAGFTTDGIERAADALAPVTTELIDAAGRLP